MEDRIAAIYDNCKWDFACIMAVEYSEDFDYLIKYLTNDGKRQTALELNALRELLTRSAEQNGMDYLTYDYISHTLASEQRKLVDQILKDVIKC